MLLNKQVENAKTLSNGIFIDRLKKAMQQKQYTQVDLAIAVGLSATAINKYLTGRNMPKPKTLFKIAEVLNIDPLWLGGHKISAYEIVKDAEKSGGSIVNEKDLAEMELNEEFLLKSNIIEIINNRPYEEVFNLHDRIYELATIDDKDWNLLLKFNLLNDTGKSRVLELADDLVCIEKYKAKQADEL